MSNQTKKIEEYNSWNAFLKHCVCKLTNYLSQCKDVSSSSQDRPDILLSNGDHMYGIEHISIPLLKIENGNAKRVLGSHENRLYKKYEIDEKSGIDKYSGNEEEAKKGIERLAQEYLDAVRSFTYSEYIENIKKLIYKHKADEYRKNISAQYPEKPVSLYFLLDIAYPALILKYGLEYQYRGSMKKELSCRKDYPFTEDFEDVLKNKKGVDYFFIIWHPYYTNSLPELNGFDENEYNESVCYIIDPNLELKKQGINNVWNSFDLNPITKFHRELKLNLVDENAT